MVLTSKVNVSLKNAYYVPLNFTLDVSPLNIEISFLETVAGFKNVGAIHEGGTDRSAQADVRGGADKSLDRHTSRCPRTESIVSFERGVCSCAELQVFSCYLGTCTTVFRRQKLGGPV